MYACIWNVVKHACMYVYMYLCMFVLMNSYIFISMYEYMYVCINKQIYKYIYLYVYMYQHWVKIEWEFDDGRWVNPRMWGYEEWTIERSDIEVIF